MRLRSIELDLPDRAAAASFMQTPWGLHDAGRRGETSFLRATAGLAYVFAVREAPQAALAAVTFSGSRAEVEAVYARVRNSTLRHGPWVEEFDEPGRGAGFCVAGAEGEPYRFVAEREATPALPADKGRPIELAHVALNSRDREAATRVLVEVFGFRLSDRTRIMNFVRCNEMHHCIAFADSDQLSLNHVAFDMIDTDAVMRGMGRLKDAGCPTAWGPGRHGPGNNVFSYFVAPFGACIEYTAEIERVGDDYPVGAPERWKWPPGRGDHWGIATRDDGKLIASGAAFPYRAAA